MQEAKNLHCVDAAASDVKHLCKWCLARPVDIFRNVLFRILWNYSARRVQYATRIQFSNSTVEKEFLMRAIEICCKQGMLIKSCRYWLLKWQSYCGKLLSDPFSSKVISFRVLVCFTYSGGRLYVAMTSWQVEYVINKNQRNLLRNLIVGISGYKLLVSRQNLFS